MYEARVFATSLLLAVVLIGCNERNGPTSPGQNPRVQLITNGEPTGSDYGNVGAILFDFNENGTIEGWEFFCSGSLIDETVFLTAAHCLAPWPPTAQLYVSFDPDLLDPTSDISPLIPAAEFHFDPEFGHDQANLHDLGVILLPEGSTAGITPVALPPADYLTELAARGGLRRQLFVNVGYGVSASLEGPPRFSFDGKRKASKSPFMALQPNWLGLLMNPHATGEGGDCFGDSGSPKFLDGHPDMIVATVTWGDRPCRATTWDYRLDTPSARAFLTNYVTLP